jgi:hypothetical protein
MERLCNYRYTDAKVIVFTSLTKELGFLLNQKSGQMDLKNQVPAVKQ